MNLHWTTKAQWIPLILISFYIAMGPEPTPLPDTILSQENVEGSSLNTTEESGDVSSDTHSGTENVVQEVQEQNHGLRERTENYSPTPQEVDQRETRETISKSTKFKTCDKTPEKFRYPYYRNKRGNDLVTDLRACEQGRCTEVLQGTKFSNRTYATVSNGFVNTVLDCYNNHYNLVIRPDDVWTAILIQFSSYINANSEEFRKQFVSFEDKKTLTVTLAGSLRNAPYDLFITEMSKEIDKNLIDKEMKDWILPNFTTTTKDDIVTSGAIFMATMKNYFNYVFNLACGIPYITLEGTVEDWEKILRRSEKLKSYKLEKWYNMLQPILKKFVETKQGNIDLNFYQRICHYEGGGSGPRYISGWISAFCVFDSEGTWVADGVTEKEPWPKIDTNKIPPGVVEANVKITDYAGEYDSVLFAGHLGYEVHEDNTTLQPRTGWALALIDS